jgi:SAM-dependent methyltransferase
MVEKPTQDAEDRYMEPPPPYPLRTTHLRRVAAAYDRPVPPLGAAARLYRREVARQLRYLIPAEASILEVGCGGGDLLALLPNRDVTGIDLAAAPLAQARTRVPYGTFLQQPGEELTVQRTFDAIIVSDTLNLAADVQQLLERLQTVAHERTRLILNFQNHLWQPLFFVATAFGLRDQRVAPSWLSSADIVQLCVQADWEPIRRSAALLCPIPLLGLDRLINRWVAPLGPGLCLTIFAEARPFRRPNVPAPRTVSIVVPARNEAGTIAELIRRTPAMGAGVELVLVEGGSTDHTWEALQAAQAAGGPHSIRVLRQSGTGKANAVREGFAAASGEILMILDADLSTPPEDLPKFYAALAANRAEFCNGSRLVYPVEREAMRFLNMCANLGFALIFRWLLGQRVKDTLCGTKALWRHDYQAIVRGRVYFGDFDPFGDFDLLFGASKLGLKITDIPVRYQERTYGQTNIRRWRHGLLLLRMTGFAAARMKFF